MIIGNFSYDKETDTYVGDVTTLSFHRTSLMFRPLEKSGEKEPDYRIVAQGAFGFVEFGAAWKRTSERGQEFLSASIDDPSLPTPLNAALFRSEDGDTASLVWSRPRAKAQTTAVTADKGKAKPKAKAA